MLSALDAGQAAGGDARGTQAAALVVAKSLAGSAGFGDRVIDLRVDDSRRLDQLRPETADWDLLASQDASQDENRGSLTCFRPHAARLVSRRASSKFSASVFVHTLAHALEDDEYTASLVQVEEMRPNSKHAKRSGPRKADSPAAAVRLTRNASREKR
jgi:uncharacterized Ntn-hydrolase superfamily protein